MKIFLKDFYPIFSTKTVPPFNPKCSYQAWRAAKDKLAEVAACKIPVENYQTGAVAGTQSAAVQICIERPDEMRFSRGGFGFL